MRQKLNGKRANYTLSECHPHFHKKSVFLDFWINVTFLIGTFISKSNCSFMKHSQSINKSHWLQFDLNSHRAEKKWSQQYILYEILVNDVTKLCEIWMPNHKMPRFHGVLGFTDKINPICLSFLFFFCEPWLRRICMLISNVWLWMVNTSKTISQITIQAKWEFEFFFFRLLFYW